MTEAATLLQRLRRAWRDITVSISGNVKPDLSMASDIDHLREQMQSCLEARGGEVSARSRAATLGQTYLGLDWKGRERFLKVLAEDFGIDEKAVSRELSALEEGKPHERANSYENLRRSLEPKRIKLLMQFNALPEGVKFLVDLRADLAQLTRKSAEFQFLDNDLRRLLTSWFDVGFLVLQRIGWDSPASLLEKLIAYEAVHEIQSWDDLKNRLDSDRRCFAFFHPRMPDEPLIFVEVALVNGLAGNVQELLDKDAPVIDPNVADTAIFYSISNAQKGLAGISFGGFLIKRVVDVLQGEFHSLKTFSTLSPIPGFRNWLDEALGSEESLLSDSEITHLRETASITVEGANPLQVILATSNWLDEDAICDAVEPVLMRLCTRYLLKEKGRGGRAQDPVEHFHLTNGALVERLCWKANATKPGMERSYGLMVNYLYRLDKIEENHEAYTGDGKIKTSTNVSRLLKI
jgi:malonyl-CoA decarboxylase